MWKYYGNCSFLSCAVAALHRTRGARSSLPLTEACRNCWQVQINSFSWELFLKWEKKTFWLFQQVCTFFSHKKGASKQPLSGDRILSSCKQEAPSSKEILIAARCNDAPIEQ